MRSFFTVASSTLSDFQIAIPLSFYLCLPSGHLPNCGLSMKMNQKKLWDTIVRMVLRKNFPA